MVKVKSFQGYLSDSQIASELASRPYDVVSRSQAKLLAGDRKHSYYHVIRPDIDLNEEIDEHDPQVYQLGKQNLDSFIEQGYLKQDTESRIYVYQTIFKGIVSTGLFTLVSLGEYERNTIKKHELTRKNKEHDRTILIETQNANAEPVLLVYREVSLIEEILENTVLSEPTLTAYTSDDQSSHKIWQLSKEVSQMIENHFQNEVDNLYIADGHHRMAASLNVARKRRHQAQIQGIQLTGEENFEYTMAFVVSTRCIKICGYHRVIKSLKEEDEITLLKKLQHSFDIQQLTDIQTSDECQPRHKGEYSFLIGGKWYRLHVKSEIKNKYLEDKISASDKLDVSILQDLCITPIFGIHDIRSDKNIEFVGGDDGIPGIEQKIFEEGNAVGIACYPVCIEELFDVADRHEIMTPKSTWIVPKPRSGLVVRKFD